MDKLREILIDYKFNDGDLDKALSEIQEIRKAEVMGVVEIAEIISFSLLKCCAVAGSPDGENKVIKDAVNDLATAINAETLQAKAWQRAWCRPAIYKSFLNHGLKK